jgi:uncharacterized protein YkwD
MPIPHARPRPLRAAAIPLTALMVAAVLGLAPPAARAASACPGAAAAPTADPAGLRSAAQATLCVVNEERALRGLLPLQRAPLLARAARGHARDMVVRAYFSHETPDGGTLSERAEQAGYVTVDEAWFLGETLGWGAGPQASPTAVVAAWLASPGHRAIVLSPRYREIGVGVAAGSPVGMDGATYALDVGAVGGGDPAALTR